MKPREIEFYLNSKTENHSVLIWKYKKSIQFFRSDPFKEDCYPVFPIKVNQWIYDHKQAKFQKRPQQDLNSCRRRERAENTKKKDNNLESDSADQSYKPNKHNKLNKSKQK